MKFYSQFIHFHFRKCVSNIVWKIAVILSRPQCFKWDKYHMNLDICHAATCLSPYNVRWIYHYNDVIMSAMASQNTSRTILYLIVHSGADHRKHQSSASLTFLRGIHRWPVNSPRKRPVTRKTFPFHDVIMRYRFACDIRLFGLYCFKGTYWEQVIKIWSIVLM